ALQKVVLRKLKIELTGSARVLVEPRRALQLQVTFVFVAVGCHEQVRYTIECHIFGIGCRKKVEAGGTRSKWEGWFKAVHTGQGASAYVFHHHQVIAGHPSY